MAIVLVSVRAASIETTGSTAERRAVISSGGAALTAGYKL